MKRGWAIAILIHGACGARLDLGDPQSADGSVATVDGELSDSGSDALGAWSSPTRIVGLPTTSGDLDDPTLTSDQLEMYFNMAGDIYVTERASIGASWSMPVAVAELNTTSGESTPDVSGDGLTIYFASTRPGGLGDFDIWMSTRDTRSAVWGAPIHVAELSSQAGDATASMTQDRLMIVTSSNRKDGVSHDLYTSTRATVNDPWGPLEELASINRAMIDDTSGFLTPDGLAIYYDSGPAGNHDLYFATRANRNDNFAPGTRIAETSSPRNDYDPWVSPDGAGMYLAAQPGAGILELYVSTR